MPMNTPSEQELQRTVVNARRRFERVLAAWVSDLLVLARQGKLRERLIDAEPPRRASDAA